MTNSRKLKVLHTIPTLGVGGAERLLVMLTPELQDRNVEVTVAYFDAPDDLRPELEQLGIKVVKLPHHYRWRLFRAARNLSALAKSENCDVIHAHLYFPSVYSGFARLLKLTKAKLVITFHNTVFSSETNEHGCKARIKLEISKYFFANLTQKLLAVSNAVKENYREATGLRNIDVIYNPVEVCTIDKVQSKISHFENGGDPIIVLPGRLVEQKGHKYLVESLALLKSRGIKFKAFFVGGGPLHGSLDKQILDLDLSDQITITGMQSHLKLLEYVARADVVAIPSIYEGFGITAVEAMAARRPVVASSVGGLPEVIGESGAGFLVEPANPAALATALEKVLGDTALASQMGENGRARVENLFTIQRCVDQLIGVYREVLNESA